MYFFLTCTWLLVSVVFLSFSSNLLLTLIVLELISFFVIFLVNSTISFMLSDYLLITLFSIFVVEGVLALSGLIFLISFSGSDYLSSFSFMQF